MLTYSVEVFGSETDQDQDQVHAWLNPNPFLHTQTELTVFYQNISASFSGTDPTVLTELKCSLNQLQSDDKYRAIASRICGPDIFAGVIRAKAVGHVEISVDDHDLTAWGRLMWGPLQNTVFKYTGQLPRLTIAEHVFSAQGFTLPNNVVSLF